MSGESRGAAGGARGGGGRRDVFLSYNSLDRDLVEAIAERLRAVGLDPWFDRWHLIAGRSWQQELASGLAASRSCAVFLDAHDFGNWELQELQVALDRATKDPSFRVFLVLLPGVPDPLDPASLPPFLSILTWVDLRSGWNNDRALQKLVDAVVGVPSGPPSTRRLGDPPYRGLRTFEEEDAELFFGRSADIQRLLEKLKSTRFVAVVGSSGIGKSSLVRAGLVPALRAGALPGSASWDVRALVPGARPLSALAASLQQLAGTAAVEATVSKLTRDPTALDAAVARAYVDRPISERIVWVVDQAEEAFTLCNDDLERQAFLDALVHASTVPGGRSLVVLVLRGDFYPRFSQHGPLAQLLSTHQALVGPLSLEGLREAIEVPARLAGVGFEDGLVTRIVDDVDRQPGALPLLQEALLQLWRRRAGLTLTHSGYDAAGRVKGAVAQQAETVFAAFDPAEQRIARRLFLRLSTPGPGTDTRRRAPLAEVESDDPAAPAVIQVLVAGRLMVTNADVATGDQWVEVSHETLIQSWPRLRQWIEEDRSGLRIHRRLTDASNEWMRVDRDDDAVYRGPQLEEAIDWAAHHSDEPNDLERAFLAAGVAARKRERWRGRRLLLLAAGMVAALTLGGWVSLRLMDQADRATSRAVAADAARQLQTNPHRALKLALEAAHHAHTREAEQVLRDALSIPAERAVIRTTRSTEHASFSPNGRRVLTVSDVDRRPHLWDIGTAESLASPSDVGAEGGAAFSPSGRLIASAGHNTVWIWTPRGEIRSIMRSSPSRPGARTAPFDEPHVSETPFSPDERLLVTGGVEGVSVWDIRNERRLRLLRTHTRGKGVSDAMFSPDGRYVVATTHDWRVGRDDGHDGTTEVWELASGRRVATVRGNTPIVSPTGRRLTTIARHGRLWTFPTGRRVASLQSGADILTFSRDGRRVLEIGQWESAAYDAEDGRRLPDLPRDLRTVPHPHLSPDGQLATSSSAVWSVATTMTLASHVSASSAIQYDAAISPDGKSVLTTAGTRLRVSALPAWDGAMTPPATPAPTSFSNTPNTVALAVNRRGWTAAFSDDWQGVRVWASPLTGPPRPRTAAAHRVAPIDVATLDDIKGIALAAEADVAVTVGPGAAMRVWRTDRWGQASTNEIRPKHLAQSGGWRDGQLPLPMALSSDGRILAVASAFGTSTWDTRSGRQLGISRISNLKGIGGMGLSKDGGLVVSSNPPVVWSSRTGKVVAKLSGRGDPSYAAAFSDDGRYVAAAGPSTVRVWSSYSGERVATWRLDRTTSLAFSPDGRFLATASAAGVDVWDSRTGRSVTGLLASPLQDAVVAFTPSGRSIVIAGDHMVQTVRCDACRDFDSLVELAERRVRRPAI